MGLFNKKIKADSGHKKNKRKDSLLTSFDKLEYSYVHTDEDLFNICDTLLGGKPVLGNFDKVETKQANEMLAFISGVVYAKGGEAIKISPKLFLFGTKEDFEDGSLYNYVEDVKE